MNTSPDRSILPDKFSLGGGKIDSCYLLPGLETAGAVPISKLPASTCPALESVLRFYNDKNQQNKNPVRWPIGK